MALLAIWTPVSGGFKNALPREAPSVRRTSSRLKPRAATGHFDAIFPRRGAGRDSIYRRMFGSAGCE
jgi:hypothetical protein